MKNKKVDDYNTPVSQLKDFIDKIKQDEKERESFYNFFDELQKDYYSYIKNEYDKQSAFDHKEIIGMLKLYLTRQTKVENIEAITRDMVDAAFIEWFNKNAWEKLPEKEIKQSLKIFFQFIKEKKGIINQAVLDFFC